MLDPVRETKPATVYNDPTGRFGRHGIEPDQTITNYHSRPNQIAKMDIVNIHEQSGKYMMTMNLSYVNQRKEKKKINAQVRHMYPFFMVVNMRVRRNPRHTATRQ